MDTTALLEYDYIIVGSGFGGAVSALRLTEKGYKVLVIEKGKNLEAKDFPKTNWNLRKWLWLPSMRFYGIFKMTLFRHVGILSGVGVGGGSLVYANTLPRPEKAFFETGNWVNVADWEKELAPHYETAEKMLGATTNPKFFDSDDALFELAKQYGKDKEFEASKVSVFFGEQEVVVPDPYFDGEGPEREGCSFCGGCMTGCKHNAKNSLDKNYLYLAQKKGAEIIAEQLVYDVKPLGNSDGEDGYEISYKDATRTFKTKKKVKGKNVIFSGGVLGTIRLLLDMKKTNLPNLSPSLGDHIRTNNESLVMVSSPNKEKDYSKGIAIGSIFPPDKDTHIEPVRYTSKSGIWKLMGVPLVHGKNVFVRIAKIIIQYLRYPWMWLRIYFSTDFASNSVILLFMQHLDSTLKLRTGWFNLRTSVSTGKTPTAFIPLAKELAHKTAAITNGKAMVLTTEALTGIPTTAHILGGAVIGTDPKNAVIDEKHRVFGYKNMYVVDGAAISANPGVNPSLTITAMSERAMSLIPAKE